MALGMYVAGPSYTWLLAAYFLLDRYDISTSVFVTRFGLSSSIPEAVFSLFMMPLSHIIDEDKRLHKRRFIQKKRGERKKETRLLLLANPYHQQCTEPMRCLQSQLSHWLPCLS